MTSILPLGKLPPELLAQLLAQAPISDPRVLLKPGIGLDCAVIEMGETLLVFKSDPITFATDEIGWYLVQVNSNDIATTGATPRWLMVTMLLPEGRTTADLPHQINQQLVAACQEKGISLIGGHTEITYGLDRPLLIGTLIGEVSKERLVTPQGIHVGDHILLTKGIPIEATAILAREFPERLRGILNETELQQARNFLMEPGISVLRDAQIAVAAGEVTAMHDPTEGGLAGALWELAEASGRSLIIDPNAIPIPDLAARVCAAFGLNPLATIASGALLLTATAVTAPQIQQALEVAGIPCVRIGEVTEGEMAVWQTADKGRILLPRPERDEIGRVFE
jgi:hydrogenase maturation factor